MIDLFKAITMSPLTLAQDEGPAPVKTSREFQENQEAFGGIWENFFFGIGGTTEETQKVDALFLMIWWIGVFFFILLMGLMIYWAFFKYRRQPGKAAEPSPSHNTPLELFWTIVPSSMLIVIFLFGWFGYMDRQVARSDALRLDVSGWKWGWEITYPGGQQSPWNTRIDRVTLPDGSVSEQTQDVKIFVLPEDTEIDLRMLSQDVIHSFWLPDFRVKMDLYPNRYTGYQFRTPTIPAGENYVDHWIFCAEYCGDYHSEMAGVFRIVSRADYEDWITNEAGGDKPPLVLGEIVYKGKCAICHSIDGGQNTGPTWLNGYGYPAEFSDGSTLEARDDNYIRESILYPAAKISAGYPNQMPSFDGQLSEAQLAGVIEYYKAQSDKYVPPDPEGAEGEEGADGEGEAEAEGGEAEPAPEMPPPAEDD
ncbi:MAG: cytochrome c oxidase subunit II [Planctomycetota bacterium]